MHKGAGTMYIVSLCKNPGCSTMNKVSLLIEKELFYVDSIALAKLLAAELKGSVPLCKH